jgi:hypothetical protein
MVGWSVGYDLSSVFSLWYGWVALALIIVGGLLGIVSSVKPYKNKMLSLGGALALFSIIIFAVGLQLDFLNLSSYPGGGTVLFGGSGSQALVLFGAGNWGGISDYVAYLSFGFWIALAAAIVMFVASRKKPLVNVTPPPPPPEFLQ